VSSDLPAVSLHLREENGKECLLPEDPLWNKTQRRQSSNKTALFHQTGGIPQPARIQNKEHTCPEHDSCQQEDEGLNHPVRQCGKSVTKNLQNNPISENTSSPKGSM